VATPPAPFTVAPGAPDNEQISTCRRGQTLGSASAPTHHPDADWGCMATTDGGTTEITTTSGERYRVQGDAREVERVLLDAARGALMQFAWLTEAQSGDDLAINPEAVAMLRSAGA
jgi:hypothetical protein